MALKPNTAPYPPRRRASTREFDESLSKEDRYRRFGEMPHFSHEQLAKMTQIDYDREMAFIVTRKHHAKDCTLGVSRVLMDPG